MLWILQVHDWEFLGKPLPVLLWRQRPMKGSLMSLLTVRRLGCASVLRQGDGLCGGTSPGAVLLGAEFPLNCG